MNGNVFATANLRTLSRLLRGLAPLPGWFSALASRFAQSLRTQQFAVNNENILNHRL